MIHRLEGGTTNLWAWELLHFYLLPLIQHLGGSGRPRQQALTSLSYPDQTWLLMLEESGAVHLMRSDLVL